MVARFPVEVDADQFDRLARPSQPMAGVGELVWNALDAEAETVTVTIGRTELDGVDFVLVTDDGHGMTYEEAIRDFQRLGGSWKKTHELSKHGKRSLHGKEGAGRFRAFAIGSTVEWTSVAESPDGRFRRTAITGSLDNSEFTVSDPEELTTGSPETSVRISQPRKYAHRLLGDKAWMSLVTQFAVYLTKYPNLKIAYDGKVLEPAAILERETEIVLDEIQSEDVPAPVLRILEWKPDGTTIKPSLILCDKNGVALHEVTNDIPSPPGISFTAYLIWASFAKHLNELLLADLGHPDLGPTLNAARDALQAYVDSRMNERRAELIQRWKTEKVYPYKEPPKTPAEVQERRMFDIVAVAAASAVAKEPKAAKLSLRLIREALGQPPGALHRVLREVLDLTAEQLADFEQLLDRTTLAAILYTSKTVVDRLSFLADLEAMLFDSLKKQRFLERSQLHRLLANGRTWIFGEEYSLAVDDRGLTKVLEAHRSLLGLDAQPDGPVKDADGHTRIVDLMLSKAMLGPERRQHLVVELKRPNLVLTQLEVNQITNYAVAVSRDERFKTPDVSWEFWLVGDDMDDVVEELVNQKDKLPGLYMEGGTYRIRVRRWAEVLEENRQHLHFYRDHLEYRREEEAELRDMVGKYLPNEVPSEPKEDAVGRKARPTAEAAG